MSAKKRQRQRDNAVLRAEIAAMRDDEIHTLATSLVKEIEELSRPIRGLKTKLGFVQEERRLRREGRDGLVISDHAVVRFMERKLGVDIESIRDQILQLAMRAQGNGHRRHDVESGLTFAVDDRSQIVATVLNAREVEHLADTGEAWKS